MKNKEFLWIILLFVCCIPALVGIFHPGFFVSDDGGWMVIRLSAFYSALASGQFPTRFLPQLNNGYGYPVADFLYPLFLYIGSVVHVVKIPFILDIKIILVGSIIFSGIGMYLFLQKHVVNFSALVGSIVFVYLPYHLYDVYARGSVGEVLALAIVPFLLWAVEKKSWMLVALFVGLLIPSHNTLALFFLPLTIVYACVRGFTLRKIILFTVTGLGLSAFFWFPALFDKQYTVFDMVSVSNPSIYFVNNISWGLLGWISLVVFIAIGFVKNFYKNNAVIFFLALGLLSLFFSFSVSSFFWHVSAFSKFIQFPFRFLSIVLISESFLAAFVIENFRKQKIIIAIFILLVMFSALPYLFPNKYDYSPEFFYTTNQDTTTVKNEYMPIGAKFNFAYDPNKLYISEPISSSMAPFISKGTVINATINVTTDTTIQVGFDYFPGWKVQIDGKDISVKPSGNGLFLFPITKGLHKIHVYFTETPHRLLADILSLITAIVLFGFWIKKRYEK